MFPSQPLRQQGVGEPRSHGAWQAVAVDGRVGAPVSIPTAPSIVASRRSASARSLTAAPSRAKKPNSSNTAARLFFVRSASEPCRQPRSKRPADPTLSPGRVSSTASRRAA
ncbi:hypothetical protein, partial [Mesorhizobium sp.]|uniref:hypothetical protein n=1 Tax=Mesorhizobium sp. TaxID=1871066 RepID=UPI00345BC05A